jgi:hypothetical protein
MMPYGLIKMHILAPSSQVFALFHDYENRLKWDTLLRAAYLSDGWKSAQLHATSVCIGRMGLGAMAVKTKYISFKPPYAAAVQLVNQPLFFAKFAATIRHRDLLDGSSEIEYKYSFVSRPKCLQWLLHPIMAWVFQYETKKRLQALATYFVQKSQ